MYRDKDRWLVVLVLGAFFLGTFVGYGMSTKRVLVTYIGEEPCTEALYHVWESVEYAKHNLRLGRPIEAQDDLEWAILECRRAIKASSW